MWNTNLYIYVEYKLVHLCGIQVCTFIRNTNLYLYVEYKHVPLCGIQTCTFMWNTRLYLYVEYKLVHLCGIQTCTFMLNTNLYLHVHLPVYYNACGKSVFHNLMLLTWLLSSYRTEPKFKTWQHKYSIPALVATSIKQ